MSRVIFKMSYKHVNFKSTQAKNVAHVTYIATRPGVDKTISENDLSKELEKDSSEDKDYAYYIDHRPRSHGLFGEDGIEDLNAVQDELETSNSFVWRGIVSLAENDAVSLGYNEKEKWQDLIRKQMPEIADKMNISVMNLRWVAAVHMEKGHPHAHIMFWEKKPTKTLGKVSKNVITEIRKGLTDEVFAEERFNLLQEKNAMRDLVKDLAIKDMGELVGEFKNIKDELDAYVGEVNTSKVGIEPRLHSDYEKALISMLGELSKTLPQRGRIAYQYMPKEVKEMIDQVTDCILKKDVFSAALEKNLIATEKLTRLYTGKEEQIENARDNAYQDIRKRLGQIVLKGAVELQKTGEIFINEEQAQKTIKFINTMSNQIDIRNEELDVLKRMAGVLRGLGYKEDDVRIRLSDWAVQNNLTVRENNIKSIIQDAFNEEESIVSMSKQAALKGLSVLKGLGYEEQSTYEYLMKGINDNNIGLEKQLKQLVEEGVIERKGDIYKATEEGIDELLKVKVLNKAEKEIIEAISENDGLGFEEIIKNIDVYSSLYNQVASEFQMSALEQKIYKYFEEKNTLRIDELEEKIYAKYEGQELDEKAEEIYKEIKVTKERIEKLVLNGYVELNKLEGKYSFTDEGLEKVKNINSNVEMTKYDVDNIIKYIELADGKLSKEKLEEFCYAEVKNKKLENEVEQIKELLEDEAYVLKEYITVDEIGNIDSTQVGKQLGIDIRRLENLLYKTQMRLSEEQIKQVCIETYGEIKGEKEFSKAIELVNKGIKEGYLEISKEQGSYRIEPTLKNISTLAYRIYQENKPINKNNLKEVLEKYIPNKDAERTFKYMTKRLDLLSENGDIVKDNNSYRLSDKGSRNKQDIEEPKREILGKALEYLETLKLIKDVDGKYQVTQLYEKYKDNFTGKTQVEDSLKGRIPDYICKLLDKNQNRLNPNTIGKSEKRFIIDNYLKGEYTNAGSSYKDIRSVLGVGNIIEKSLNSMAKVLLATGLSKDIVVDILKNWNLRSNSQIDNSEIEEAVKTSYESVADNNNWKNTTVVSRKEWDKLFSAMNISKEDAPQWMYNDYRLQVNTLGSIVNRLWKSIWSNLERTRLQEEAKVNNLKKQLNRQQGLESKAARKEAARKHRGSSFEVDDRFEL